MTKKLDMEEENEENKGDKTKLYIFYLSINFYY